MDSLVTRGSILLETRLTPGRRPQTLLRYTSTGSWPVQLAISSLPGGGATFVLDQADKLAHAVVSLPHTERLETIQITYSWDAPRKWGRLVMLHVDSGRFAISELTEPAPIRLSDLEAMIHEQNATFITPDAEFLAVSTEIEPTGPCPSLVARTPIETPLGEVPVARLRRGNTVRTETGDSVPVLFKLSRTVPARGSFAPVRLRAPYFGLRRDTLVAPTQRLKISGSVVDYMFSTEAVLASASHLVGGTAIADRDHPSFVTYHHVLLPQHEAILSSGMALESLYIGRLRRKKDLLAATVLAGLDRARLPEHSTPAFPILRQYDALVLAEQRSA
ncbi:MAG: Hint domain-containing protein [Paracoccaceae bacterium]